MHFTNKIWHRLLQSVHANRSAREPGSLSLSSSICGLLRFKKGEDGADQLKMLVPFVHHPALWKFSDVWRLVVTIRFRGRCSPTRNEGQEMLSWGWETLRPGGLWFPEVWGCGHGGPTVWMNQILKEKFKLLWWNKGGTGFP